MTHAGNAEMIELPVQTTLPSTPIAPETAGSGAIGGADFAAQLAQLAAGEPSEEGESLPPSGKILPPVYRPAEPTAKVPGDIITPSFVVQPEDPAEVELKAEQVPPTTTPIMRPLARLKEMRPTLSDPTQVIARPEAHSLPSDEAPAAELPPASVVAQPAIDFVIMPLPAPALPNSGGTQHSAASVPSPAPGGQLGQVRQRIAALAPRLAVLEVPVAPQPPTAPAPQVLATTIPAIAAAQGKPAEPSNTRRSIKPVSESLAVSATDNRAAQVVLPASRLQPAVEANPLTATVGDLRAVTPVQLAAPFSPPISDAAAPQDFAALIDRIVAAREASGAPVAVAVRHAEFGAVTLRFEQADGTLSVAASSPDPDFARAAAAALPPDRPAMADQAPRDGGKSTQHGDGQADAQTQTNTSGQPRHSAAAPTRSSVDHPNSQSATDPEARDSGIFA